jgi:hypothetical protein
VTSHGKKPPWGRSQPSLAFLAPAIVEAIMKSRQPVGLTPRALKRIGLLPYSWDDQRRRLGFPA